MLPCVLKESVIRHLLIRCSFRVQEIANTLARRSLYAIARLGGYLKMPTNHPRAVSQSGTPSETPLHASQGESNGVDRLSQSGDANAMTQSRTSSNGSKTPSGNSDDVWMIGSVICGTRVDWDSVKI